MSETPFEEALRQGVDGLADFFASASCIGYENARDWREVAEYILQRTPGAVPDAKGQTKLSDQMEADYQARKAAQGPLEQYWEPHCAVAKLVAQLEANQRTPRDEENERMRGAYIQWDAEAQLEDLSDRPDVHLDVLCARLDCALANHLQSDAKRARENERLRVALEDVMQEDPVDDRRLWHVLNQAKLK